MQSAHEVYSHYDTLSRKRALTLHESRELEKAIKAIDSGQESIKLGKLWTASEIERLRNMAAQGLPFGEIAVKLGRGRSTVFRKWKEIGGQG